MPQIIDSHFHSQSMKENSQDLNSAWSSIYSGIDIGTLSDDFPQRAELLKNAKHIHMSAAMGPWETENASVEQIDSKFRTLLNNIEKYKPLFIGEAGLDNYWKEYGTPQIQEYLFIKQLKLADKLKKCIIIHNREADNQMVEILKKHSPSKGGIIHCFSGNLDVLKTAIDNGFFISYAGNITYKSNQELRETIKYVPKDRLLFETDAPYLSPVPVRGKKNSPEFIIYTYECAAQILNKSTEELEEVVLENFENLVRISESE